MIWHWIVDAAAARARADARLLAAIVASGGDFPGAGAPTRSQLQAWIKEGRVTQDGTALKAGAPLTSGAQIEIRVPAPAPSGLVPEDRPLEILFEDEHLAIVNKPAGLTVHPSATQRDGTLVHALLHHIRDLSGIGGELRPGIVHRIDKDTSGALVITKHDRCHQKLAEIFARHDIERAYWALCYGALPAPQGTVATRIGRSPKDRKRMAVLEEGGREAVTHYSTLARYSAKAGRPFASFVELRLETGRTHQIRVHLAHLRASVLGDPAYGVPSVRAEKWTELPAAVQALVRELPGQALHARTLGFVHPMTGERLRAEAAPPPAVKALQAALAAYLA